MRWIAIAFLGLCGCGDDDGNGSDGPDADADTDADADVDTDADTDTGTEGNGFHLGTFSLQTYSVPFEGDYPGDPDTPLPSCGAGEPVATVPADFVTAMEAATVGKLLDGRIVIPAGGCYDVSATEWGAGTQGRPRAIYRSAAAHPSDVAIDRWIWIPQMDGVTLPGDADGVHDGCVRLDDERDDVESRWFSIFIGLQSRREEVEALLGAEIDAYQDSPECFGWEG